METECEINVDSRGILDDSGINVVPAADIKSLARPEMRTRPSAATEPRSPVMSYPSSVKGGGGGHRDSPRRCLGRVPPASRSRLVGRILRPRRLLEGDAP